MREPERLEGSLDLERQADTTAVAEGAADDGRWARGREDAEGARWVRVRTRLGQSSGHGGDDERRETSGGRHGNGMDSCCSVMGVAGKIRWLADECSGCVGSKVGSGG